MNLHEKLLLKSLKVVWKSIDPNHPYAYQILTQLGHTPRFPDSSLYRKWWAIVTTAEVLGEAIPPGAIEELKREADRMQGLQPVIDQAKREIEDSQRRIDELEAEIKAIEKQIGEAKQ